MLLDIFQSKLATVLPSSSAHQFESDGLTLLTPPKGLEVVADFYTFVMLKIFFDIMKKHLHFTHADIIERKRHGLLFLLIFILVALATTSGGRYHCCTTTATLLISRKMRLYKTIFSLHAGLLSLLFHAERAGPIPYTFLNRRRFCECRFGAARQRWRRAPNSIKSRALFRALSGHAPPSFRRALAGTPARCQNSEREAFAR